MARLVDDVSDLSRLHAGTLETYLRPVDLDDVIAASLEDLGPGGHHITLQTHDDLPDVIADAALLTRTLTSLMADALHRSPADAPPALTAAVTGSNVTIRLTDHGAGPAAGNGGGLALRLARDLTEAMGDTFRCGQTPAGGRSVAITLPAARPSCHPVTADGEPREDEEDAGAPGDGAVRVEPHQSRPDPAPLTRRPRR